jgi:plasmid stabilization system protein ParE
MNYSIVIEPEAQKDLYSIYDYIANNDSIAKARNFIQELKASIDSLSFMPQRCRNSLYVDDGKTKDLIYKGYTICYHILDTSVHIVAIFRQR